MIKNISLTKDWEKNSLKKFLELVSDESFPCLFGKKSILKDSYYPVFISTNNDRNHLLKSFIEYTDLVKTTEIKDRIYSPLIIFFSQSLEKSFNSQHELAWDILNWLHLNDPEEWPSNIPIEPSDPNWCFCFNGVQTFINMSSSSHQILKSRNLGDNLVFVVNPRENFDFVASGEKGKKIRTQIRNRVSSYNNGYVPPELGFYGDGSKEWLQYQLEEKGMPRPSKCPFQHTLKENQ